MIYLDNAATTFPKPPSVIDETCRCLSEYCGNSGRGAHYLARAASEKLFEAREMLSSFFGCESPENVVFTLNTTYALNLAVKSLVKKGDHALISDMEHNSVVRPLSALSDKGDVSFSVFKTFGGDADKIVSHVESKIRSNTRVLICQHSSNICGTVLPIKRIGELCSKKRLFFIVDAAQSAGLFDIDMKACHIDALCVPSHKGLYGPQGAGAVLFGSGAFRHGVPETVTEGGSGTNSLDTKMPSYLPDRYEAGTMPTPAIAGLCSGISFVKRLTPYAIRSHEEELGNLLKLDLLEMKGIRVYEGRKRSGIVLFNADGISPSRVSLELDRSGICTRSGLHCTPLAHETVGTGKEGAVRISFGAFNDMSHAKMASDRIFKICRELGT